MIIALKDAELLSAGSPSPQLKRTKDSASPGVPRVIFPRVEPTEFLTDAVFKRHFQFDKRNVERIADMLDLEHPNNRGNPLTPIQAEMGIQDDQKQ